MSELISTQPGDLSIHERAMDGQTPVIFSGTTKSAKAFWEFFFGASIDNEHTRRAYLFACFRFADWCQSVHLELEDVESVHVMAYITQMQDTHSKPSIKQHLTAIRKLFNHLIIRQVIAANPAMAVAAPKYKRRKIGATPVLSATEMRQLFASIELTSFVAYRDRAIIATMAYSFARVSAVCKLRVKDYYTQSKNSYFLLDEKGGVQNKVPAHHNAQRFVDEYLALFPLYPEADTALFRTMKRNKKDPDERGMSARTILDMVKRRCLKAGLPIEICNHSFRGTGITNYMKHGGTLEQAAKIAGHASTTTTQLYDRRDDEITLDEIERIHY